MGGAAALGRGDRAALWAPRPFSTIGRFAKGGTYRKVPDYTAFRNLLRQLDPDAFASVLGAWLAAQSSSLPKSLAPDGKLIRETVGVVCLTARRPSLHRVRRAPAAGRTHDKGVASWSSGLPTCSRATLVSPDCRAVRREGPTQVGSFGLTSQISIANKGLDIVGLGSGATLAGYGTNRLLNTSGSAEVASRLAPDVAPRLGCCRVY